MSDVKVFQAMVRPKGTEEWRAVTYSGQRFYADAAGLGQLRGMTSMMAQHFQYNEYQLEETSL